CSEARDRRERWVPYPLLTSLRLVFRLGLGTVAQVMHEDAHESADNGNVADPLQGVLPELDGPRDVRGLGKAAIKFGIGGVVQHVNHAGAADSRRIVHAGLSKAIEPLGLGVVVAKLFGAMIRLKQHIILGSEVQTPCRASLDASWLKILRHAVRAER